MPDRKEVPAVGPELLIRANYKVTADLVRHASGDAMVSVVTALAPDCPAEQIVYVAYRLIALARLVQEGDGEAWLMNDNAKKYRIIDEALFRAAARAPLIEAETVGNMQFNKEELLAIALEESEPKGAA